MEHSHRGLLSPVGPHVGRRLSSGRGRERRAFPGCEDAAETVGAERVGKTGAAGQQGLPVAALLCWPLSRGLSRLGSVRLIGRGRLLICVSVYVSSSCELRLFCPSGMHHPSPGFGRPGADRDFPLPAAPRRKRLKGPGSSPFVLEAGRDFTHTLHMKARTLRPGVAFPRRILYD